MVIFDNEIHRDLMMIKLEAGIQLRLIPKSPYPVYGKGDDVCKATQPIEHLMDIKYMFPKPSMADPYGETSYICWRIDKSHVNQGKITYANMSDNTPPPHMTNMTLTAWLEMEIAKNMDNFPDLVDVPRPTRQQLAGLLE